MWNKLILFTAGFLFFTSCENVAQQKTETVSPSGSITFKLTPIVSSVVSPVYLTNAGDGSNRLFYLEQRGQIRIIKNGKLLEAPFLDLTSKVIPQSNTYSERGLLGLAFHPDYKNNGKFYVYYSAPAQESGIDHTSVISEFQVSSNSDVADTKERVILTFGQPESNHNGGQLLFGKDGYLYIGSGDGGGGGDKHGKIGNAQDLSNLLGKILRIDINGKAPYTIPADNPFVNKGGRGEIWAYGLRNPWRFSIDKETDKMYCGDVGQNKYEETNIIVKGGNYGWRKYEGFHVYDKDMNLSEDKVVMPIDEYSHDIGNSICGGIVYRGSKNKALNGKYVFGDWSGKLFYLQQDNDGEWKRFAPKIEGLKEGITLNNIGEGEDGEIYVLVQEEVGPNKKEGIIYKLEYK